MICFPNAKINLGLNIVSKRNDGYHNLETIFYPIMIKDALEIIVKENLTEDVYIGEGINVNVSPESNLVMKALKAMREKYTFPKVEVHLLKKIPFGAGIGGGSADAAFMLRLINETFGLNATNDELAAIAAKIGADCPFFIYNRPMFASSIGEMLEDVDLSLDGYKLVLVKPDVHISTKEAFSSIKPKAPQTSLKEIIKLPVSEWKDLMVNNFEEGIFEQFPAVRDVKDKLYSLGAEYASMSGSGSSVYALFKEKPLQLENHFPDCYAWMQ